MSGPLFLSSKAGGSKGTGTIPRQQAHRVIREAARATGISEAISAETLRKTYEYWAFSHAAEVTCRQEQPSSAPAGRSKGKFTAEELD